MTSAENTSPFKDWKSLSTACLDVSLNNRYEGGAYLASTFKWITSRFDDCIISLGDTLHRHNLRREYADAKKAHAASREMGDRWLANNNDCFQFLGIPYKIIRSDDWLEDPDFEPVHEALWSFYYTDKDFQAVVYENIQTFVRRKQNLPASVVRESSLAYLLEETAADILLGQRGGVAHLYPGSRHQCYDYLIEKAQELPQKIRGLENSAFKRLSPAKIAIPPSKLISTGIQYGNHTNAA